MQILFQKVKNYGKEVWSRKKRLALAAVVSLILFFTSLCYLYSGINKRFFTFTILCVGVGAFLVCPRIKKWYLSIPIVLLYLAWVPRKMFQRIELPTHDLAQLIDGAELMNLLIILLVYTIFFLLFQQIRIALGGGGIVILILFLVNYYVVKFRGTCLGYTDLLATRTALSVLNSYQLTMDGELWFSILYFCFFITWGFWCELPWKKGKWYHLTVSVITLAYLVFFYALWDVSEYLEDHQLGGIYWAPSTNQKMNGFLLSFAANIKDMSMRKPLGYTQKTLQEIADQTDETYQQPDTIESGKPNIILIMNESWSDLQVLGNIETSVPYMAFGDSLTDNTVKGNLYVEILGGLTANTEFEVLTGDSLTFLASTAVPYQLQVNHEMYSLARVLREQGYQTMAMHPNIKSAWNREQVYGYFGFEEFIDVEKFQTKYGYVESYISDECNFNEIIWQYEHKRKEVPLFLFDVTIQNHGGYYRQDGIPMHIEKLGNTEVEEGEEFFEEETYLNLMRITDGAFEMLINYFQNVEEPTIICMFGDHQPYLNDDFYSAIFSGSGLTEKEQEARKYITPYVIWANYEVEFPEYGDMSANYLGAAVLECGGVELPAYYKFLLLMQRQYPVLSSQTFEQLKKENTITQYQMLQYNHLIEKNYRKELFSVCP